MTILITGFTNCSQANSNRDCTGTDSSLCRFMHQVYEGRLNQFRSISKANVPEKIHKALPQFRSEYDTMPPYKGYFITLKMEDEDEFESLIDLVKNCFPSHQFDVMYMSKADFFNKAVYTEVPGRPFLGNGYGDVNINLYTTHTAGESPFEATVAFTIEDTLARSYFTQGANVRKEPFHEDLQKVIDASRKNFRRFDHNPNKLHNVSETLGITGAIRATLQFNGEKLPGHYNTVLHEAKTDHQAQSAFDSLSILLIRHFGEGYEYRTYPTPYDVQKQISFNEIGCSFYNNVPELYLMLSKVKKVDGYKITLSISHQ